MMHGHEGKEEHSECTCGMSEMYASLTEAQKKEVMAMKLETKIMWLEKKIKDMENAIAVKKVMVENMRKLQTMLKSK